MKSRVIAKVKFPKKIKVEWDDGNVGYIENVDTYDISFPGETDILKVQGLLETAYPEATIVQINYEWYDEKA